MSNLSSRRFSDSTKSLQAKRHRDAVEDVDSDAESEESYLNELSLSEMRLHQSAVESCSTLDMIDELTSSDDEKLVCDLDFHSRKSQSSDSSSRSKYRRSIYAASGAERKLKSSQSPQKRDAHEKRCLLARLNQFRVAPRAYWPYWVYQMYDSFSLAQKAAGTFPVFPPTLQSLPLPLSKI